MCCINKINYLYISDVTLIFSFFVNNEMLRKNVISIVRLEGLIEERDLD